jgi:predicted HTH transcriptional regulator
VWYPKTWPEVQALIDQAVETSSLDFKRSIATHNEELAKDIAAMTLDGGVLLYGVDEDRKTTLAKEITPVEIGGVEIRLQQVIGSHIRPVPDVATEFIADPDDPTRGVLAVVVPASVAAPHQTAGRYPCRRGTTTSFLEEAEVERLYRQRRAMQGAPLSATELTDTQFVGVLADAGAQESGT